MARTDIFLRECKQADMEQVIVILQSISEFKPLKKDYSSIWNNFCKQTNVRSLVATIDETVVGYGSVVMEQKIRGGKFGHVEDIAVDPNYKKNGIAKIIVDSLFDLAKLEGCYKVSLQCQEHNIEFYKKCNYELSGLAMQRFIS